MSPQMYPQRAHAAGGRPFRFAFRQPKMLHARWKKTIYHKIYNPKFHLSEYADWKNESMRQGKF